MKIKPILQICELEDDSISAKILSTTKLHPIKIAIMCAVIVEMYVNLVDESQQNEMEELTKKLIISAIEGRHSYVAGSAELEDYLKKEPTREEEDYEDED